MARTQAGLDRRRFLQAVAAGAVAGALVSCSGDDGESGGAAEPSATTAAEPLGSTLRLPTSMAEVVEVVDAAGALLGPDVVRLEPWSEADIAALRDAVRPDVLTGEVVEFLRSDLVSPWREPRPTLEQCLLTFEIFRGDFGAPHWLPIGVGEEDNWCVVLGGEELERSPIAVWSSAGLTTSAPFPSLRTFLLGYADALWAARSRYVDVQADLAFSEWWLAHTDAPPIPEHLALRRVLERPLKDLVAAEDASPLWPRGASPMPWVDDVDRRAWDPRWIDALRVEVR